MIPVKVVLTMRTACVIEVITGDDSERRIVPKSKIINGEIDEETFKKGILYGFDWKTIDIHIEQRELSAALHNNGIWTIEDALREPKAVKAAVEVITAKLLKSVLETANAEKKRRKANG